MRRELIISAEKIDEAVLMARRQLGGETGAAVYFLGFVRGQEEGREIDALDYEAFERMARHQFDLLFEQAAQRWTLHSIRLAHRTGRVAVGEASLWLEILAPHRGEAFAAGQFLIDEMKRAVPIWKKAVFQDQRAAS
jgi:molybdopterin synthase catalytic subunit